MIIFAILANSFYFCTILFKFFLFQLGMLRPRNSKQSEKAAKALKDKDLPTYTILIPLFQEAATLPSMLSGLRKLDYPKTKLDVKFICEADDKETIEAAKALQAEYFIEIIRVPYSLPRTKPKACNYALRFAKGDYVTIYDAEDRPEPLQLKKAIATFKSHKKDVVCLQARLNYYNRDDNILTRLFAIEYAAWFDFMLRGLEYLRIPIPLGGTSNHLNIRKLKELGEWDPFNVTEDADLGIRLAQAGYKTALLDSITLEEAPIHFMSWLKQRTRWIKGYMQTWLVHMREPISLYRSLGSRGFWGFQFFIGGPCLVFLLAPMLWIIAIFWLTQDVNLPLESKLPTWFWGTGIFSLIAGILLHSYFAMFIVSTRRWKSMLGAEVVFPFYWLLHSIASFRALWHLIIKPHHWEKTDHGLTQFSEQRLAKAAKESG
jgi:cellulose synthase/poly-beta-1,6-N-acetylglucosamine synthase-like glycosyltransferase